MFSLSFLHEFFQHYTPWEQCGGGELCANRTGVICYCLYILQRFFMQWHRLCFRKLRVSESVTRYKKNYHIIKMYLIWFCKKHEERFYLFSVWSKANLHPWNWLVMAKGYALKERKADFDKKWSGNLTNTTFVIKLVNWFEVFNWNISLFDTLFTQ